MNHAATNPNGQTKTQWQETRCIRCSKANAIECNWIGNNDLTGRKYIERFVSMNGTGSMRQVSITYCPFYNEGPMSNIYWRIIPLTTPKTNNTNYKRRSFEVRVAK